MISLSLLSFSLSLYSLSFFLSFFFFFSRTRLKKPRYKSILEKKAQTNGNSIQLNSTQLE